MLWPVAVTPVADGRSGNSLCWGWVPDNVLHPFSDPGVVGVL